MKSTFQVSREFSSGDNTEPLIVPVTALPAGVRMDRRVFFRAGVTLSGVAAVLSGCGSPNAPATRNSSASSVEPPPGARLQRPGAPRVPDPPQPPVAKKATPPHPRPKRRPTPPPEDSYTGVPSYWSIPLLSTVRWLPRWNWVRAKLLSGRALPHLCRRDISAPATVWRDDYGPEYRDGVGENLFVIPLEDGIHSLVYAPLQKVAFVANTAMADHFTKFIENPETDSELHGWLHELGVLDHKPIEVDAHFDGVPRPTSVTLFLTTACNLRCTYCYASTGEQPVESLDQMTAMRSIDVVISNAVEMKAREIGLAFHGGGEPTVAWAVLTNSLNYARHASEVRGLTVRASITTNGVLSEAKAEWIANNLDLGTVSCDGLPEVQNRNRLTVLGSGSSPQVEKTLNVFDAAGFRYGLRLTVTPSDVNCLPRSVEYLCSSHRPELIQVEPAH